jgi:hypothetical protein
LEGRGLRKGGGKKGRGPKLIAYLRVEAKTRGPPGQQRGCKSGTDHS